MRIIPARHRFTKNEKEALAQWLEWNMSDREVAKVFGIKNHHRIPRIVANIFRYEIRQERIDADDVLKHY